MTDTLTPAQRRTVRHLKVRALRRKGMTQAAIAAQVGMSQQRVGQLLQINPVMAPKPCKKGKQTVYQLGSGTDPAKAAERIREVFGDAFAEALGEQLSPYRTAYKPQSHPPATLAVTDDEGEDVSGFIAGLRKGP